LTRRFQRKTGSLAKSIVPFLNFQSFIKDWSWCWKAEKKGKEKKRTEKKSSEQNTFFLAC